MVSIKVGISAISNPMKLLKYFYKTVNFPNIALNLFRKTLFLILLEPNKRQFVELQSTISCAVNVLS